MKFAVFALLLSIAAIAVVPISALLTYSEFGAENVNLELMHANMVRAHYLFLAISALCLGVVIYTLVLVKKSSNVIVVISIAIVFLSISLILYGPSIIQGLSDLSDIKAVQQAVVREIGILLSKIS